MPQVCTIKGKINPREEPDYRGTHHMEGCAQYRVITKPNRWFCSEDDAKAASFRKAYTCQKVART
jgi:hypothetical protein